MPRKSYQNGLPIKPRVCCMQYYVNYNTIAIGWAIIWATVYRTGLPWNGHRLNQWASTQSVGIDPISKTQPPISGHRPNTCKDLTLGSTPEGDTKQKATQSRRRRKRRHQLLLAVKSNRLCRHRYGHRHPIVGCTLQLSSHRWMISST